MYLALKILPSKTYDDETNLHVKFFLNFKFCHVPTPFKSYLPNVIMMVVYIHMNTDLSCRPEIQELGHMTVQKPTKSKNHLSNALTTKTKAGKTENKVYLFF